jgi:ribonuclease P protein component
MRKALRLRGRKAFDAVFQQGRLWANELLILRAAPNGLEHNRYGFVVSKRLGKAVIRNRVRRRVREGLRSLSLPPGWDIVVSARGAAARADYHALKRAVASLLARAGVLAADREEGR